MRRLNFPDSLARRLEEARSRHLLRTLLRPRGEDCCSNDYLGFGSDPAFRERVRADLGAAPTGAGGSRLIRGNLALYEAVERKLADFSNQEAALLFGSGYQANVALLSAILGPGDRVFSDELNHASLIDGIRLSGANRSIYRHADVASLRASLEAAKPERGLKVIVTESFFSMDGDLAPLTGIAGLAAEHGAWLVVDEAHATGLSARGGGRVSELGLDAGVLATIHTGGKALGCGGAWVAGSEALKAYLVNFARPFLFSTAPIPSLAISLGSALGYWREVGPGRINALIENCDLFRAGMRGFVPEGVAGPIFPIVLGDAKSAREAADRIQAAGFDVRAIRPPTVAEGASRLRVTMRADTPMEALRGLVGVLRRECRPR